MMYYLIVNVCMVILLSPLAIYV